MKERSLRAILNNKSILLKPTTIIILILAVIIMIVIILALVNAQSPDTGYFEYSYGWDSENEIMTNYDSLSYQTNVNGIVTVKKNGTTIGYFGFVLTGNVDGEFTNYSSEDFTWTWSHDTIGEEHIFRAYNNQPQFNWTQIFHFYPDEPMKIKHVLTNDYKLITNAKIWYVHTLEEEDGVWFNNTYHKLNLSKDKHYEGEFDNYVAKVEIDGKYFFNYTDIVNAGFNITDVFIGNGSIVGHPHQYILGVGVTKGARNFPVGYTLEIDPSIEAVDTTNNAGDFSSISIDSSGNIHIVYFYDTSDDWKHCERSGSSWSCENIATTDRPGYYGKHALDSNDKIHAISFEHTDDDLYYCNNTGGSWGCQYILPSGSATDFGMFPSIAVDLNDEPHVVCKNNSDSDIYYCNKTTGTWACKNIDDLGGISSSSIAVDSNNNLHVVYQGNSSDAKYCNTTNNFGTVHCEVIEEHATDNLGNDPSLVIDENNKLHATYEKYDNAADEYTLRYCNNLDGTWHCENADEGGAAGDNYGYDTSLVIAQSNIPYTIHFDDTNNVIRYCNKSEGGIWECNDLTGSITSWPNNHERALTVKKGRLPDSTTYDMDYAHFSYYNDTSDDLYYGNMSVSTNYIVKRVILDKSPAIGNWIKYPATGWTTSAILNTDDSDTAYMYSSANGADCITAMENITAVSGYAIDNVTIHSRCRKTGAISGNMVDVIMIRDGTKYGDDATGHSLTTSYATKTDVWTTDPADSNAWTWTDINNTEIQLENYYPKGSTGDTRCTYVEMIIYYSLAAQAPVVTLVNPTNASTKPKDNILFNCSATDNTNLTNVTLYGNWTGSWHANETKSVTGESNVTNFTKNISVGTYIWNCYACDEDSLCAFADNNWTFTSSPCGEISESYTLLSDVSSSGTCFTIKGHEIIIDCDGYNINGNGTGYAISNSDGYDNITIKNCNITNFYSGVMFDSAKNSIIKDNYFYLNKKAGIWLNQSSSSNITNNSVFSTYASSSDEEITSFCNLSNLAAESGIILCDSNHSIVNKNIITANGTNGITNHDGCGAGIAVRLSNSSKITNNEINNTDTYGIYFDDSYYSEVLYNTINGSGSSGTNTNDDIIVDGRDLTCDNNNISHNYVCCASEWGIFLNHANYTYVYNNTIEKIDIVGVRAVSSSNRIFDNYFEDNAEGVRGHYTNNSIINNTFINQTTATINLQSGSSDFVIKNNVIINSTGKGIYIYSTIRTIINENNITTNNAGATGITAVSTYYTNITNNTIITFDDSSEGMWFSNAENNTIINNTIYTNTSDGLVFQANSSNNMVNNSIFNSTSDYALYIWNASNNKIYNTIFNTSITTIFIGGDNTGENNLTNTTLRNITFHSGPGKLNVHWYLDAYVNDSAGNDVVGADVIAYDINNTLHFNKTTDSNGNIAWQVLLEFMENKTQKYMKTNYTLKGTNGTLWSQTEQVNLTTNKIDENKIVLTLEPVAAPIVSYVKSIPAVDLNGGTTKDVEFMFNVTGSNINDTSGSVTITYGSESRTNDSCVNYTYPDQFNCTISMQFYDTDGEWNINASIQNLGGTSASNTTVNFTVNTLDQVSQDITTITWTTIYSNTNDNEADAPMILTNEGNQNYSLINFTGYGATGTSHGYKVYAENFSLFNATGETTDQLYIINATGVNDSIMFPDLDAHGASITQDVYFYVDVGVIVADTYNDDQTWNVEVAT